jgi:hypothetical protein
VQRFYHAVVFFLVENDRWRAEIGGLCLRREEVDRLERHAAAGFVVE